MAFNDGRKPYSASRSRKTSEQLRSATYGTHVKSTPQVSRMSRHSGNAAGVGFSSSRRAKRATRGYVDQITPTATSGESKAQHSRRMNKRGFSQEVQRKSHLGRILFFVITILLVVGVGAFAANTAFFASVDGKLRSADEDLPKALVAQEEGKPYYALITADLTKYRGTNDADVVLLARIDEGEKQITLVTIPGNYRVFSNNMASTLSAVSSEQGDAALVRAASSALGVDISHFLRVDQELVENMVDDLGGVPLTIEETVDDPRAGNIYIPVGEQTLDGPSSVEFLMARNYSEGCKTMLSCQRTFLLALISTLFSEENSASLGTNLDGISGHISTDWSGHDLIAVADLLKEVPASSLYTGQVPGTDMTTDSLGLIFVPSNDGVAGLMASVDAGNDPSSLTVKGEVNVDKSSFEIIVKNGSGIAGGASTIAQILTDNGFQVAETGNADSYVYKETLVIYLDPQYEQACQAVVQTLGTGRVVNGANYYSFDKPVQVVLGSDWKPLN